MQSSNLHPNIRPLLQMAMVREFNFLIPVIIVFLQMRGITAAQFMLVQSFFMVAMLIADPLVSPLADRFGRRTAIIWGSVFWVLGNVIIVASYNWQFYAFGEAVLGLGMAAFGPASRALLFDTFMAISRKEDHYAASTHQASRQSYAGGVGMLIGGLIFMVSPTLTAVMTVATSLVLLPLAWRLSEVPIHTSITEKTPTYRAMWKQAWSSLSTVQTRWLVIMPALITGSTITLFWSFQPVFVNAGVPTGVASTMLAVMFVCRGMFTKMCPDIVRRFTGCQCFGLCIAGLAISFSCMAILPWWLGSMPYAIGSLLTYVPFILGVGCAFPLASTIGNELLNRHLPSEIRSTALGASSVLGRLVSIMTLGGAGLLQPLVGLPVTLLIIGGTAVVLATLSYTRLPRETDFLATARQAA